MTYASVVSRNSVRIALTLTTLHDVYVMMGDIENAYLTSPITEKAWTVLGLNCEGDIWPQVRGRCLQKSPGILHGLLGVEALSF
jgi:hypothetical protein